MTPEKKALAIVGHIGIEVSDLSKSRKFYETLLKDLDFAVIMETEKVLGFSNQNFQVWISEPTKTRVKRGSPVGEEFIVADHLAILVGSKEAVDDADVAMKKNGFNPLFPCEEYPEFCPGYYAVSFCDPDNYVIEIYTRPRPK